MLFILFTDHGYHLGEKQRWSKFSLWERTTRVPFIVSVPGYTPGKSAKPIELLSIVPTNGVRLVSVLTTTHYSRSPTYCYSKKKVLISAAKTSPTNGSLPFLSSKRRTVVAPSASPKRGLRKD